MIKSEIQIFYREPRLEMSILGRFLIRLISYSTYGILMAATVAFSFSDVRWLKAIGFLFVLFLVDRLLHIGEAERHLARLPANKANAADYLTSQGFAAIEYAFDRALVAGGDFWLYLARKLIGRKEVREGLRRLDVNSEELEVKLEEYIKSSLIVKNIKTDLIAQVEQLAQAAFWRAYAGQSEFIEPKDLFSALSAVKNPSISKLLKFFEIGENDLENALVISRFKQKFSGLRRLPASLTGFVARPFRIRERIMNRAWTARPTPFLDQYSEDLTALAHLEKIGFLIGHEQEYDRLVDVLARPGNPNALLVGEPGSGKSTLVAHLAYKIAKDRVPSPLFDKRLISLEIGSLVAGAAEGDLQERIKKIIDEIILAGNIILYIPDIHNLAKTSGQMRLSAADILMPAIKSSAFQVIGASYPREFREFLEPNSDFVSAFEVIRVQEISEAEATKFLVYDAIVLESQYRMVISFSAIKQAVALAHKYFREKLLPASAENLLKETLADAAEKRMKLVKGEDVIAVAQKKINVPLQTVKKDEAQKLLNLEQLIHERLIDQEAAVKAVSSALREYRSGLSRKGGPIAAFLFIGPTGVGKTELSKILAQINFGSKDAMIRFDMSEYQVKESLYRFIGSPDGKSGGTLTDAVRERPYSLILLDEFEKAHPDILNLFLQVFDDGRLTDSLGRTVDFQNTIIIATSNAHSDFIKLEIEKGGDMKIIGEELKKKLTDVFRPELLNRFSDTIVFRNLLPEHIKAIAKLLLVELTGVLMEEHGIDLSFDDSAIGKIAELGYDPIFGARPLRGVISEQVRSVLAEKILKGEIIKGGAIILSFKGDKFEFISKNA